MGVKTSKQSRHYMKKFIGFVGMIHMSSKTFAYKGQRSFFASFIGFVVKSKGGKFFWTFHC
ncbi:hypothetical protein AN964_15945 [Heyndrickxia shackletonii]|uniref:Uncharacterized protein n=1 Tax=Heyndrickxia shackletonii TaxID=157838 RepID=A0A0Q3TLK9_9BACI|nr:hypothetical protein AN964_15945 [Heyndrickxia shackletonii]